MGCTFQATMTQSSCTSTTLHRFKAVSGQLCGAFPHFILKIVKPTEKLKEQKNQHPYALHLGPPIDTMSRPLSLSPYIVHATYFALSLTKESCRHYMKTNPEYFTPKYSTHIS